MYGKLSIKDGVVLSDWYKRDYEMTRQSKVYVGNTAIAWWLAWATRQKGHRIKLDRYLTINK